MNWEAVGAIAELLAAVGAIAALVYLALQLKQNTYALDRSERAARAATSFHGAHSWADVNMQLGFDAEMARLTAESFEADSPDFSKLENIQLHYIARGTMERLDGLHYLYKNGQIEEELWSARLVWARRWLDRPYWKSWWARERETSNYSPSLVAEIEREAADCGPL